MTTARDWAQVNTTKSEGSSAICRPRTWKCGSAAPACISGQPRLPSQESRVPTLPIFGFFRIYA